MTQCSGEAKHKHHYPKMYVMYKMLKKNPEDYLATLCSLL